MRKREPSTDSIVSENALSLDAFNQAQLPPTGFGHLSPSHLSPAQHSYDNLSREPRL